MKTDDTPPQLALRLLARRDYPRSELRRKLQASEFDLATIDATLDELEEQGTLSDQRYAEAFIHAKGERYGKTRLRQELMQRGVKASAIAAALEGIVDQDSQLQLARVIWQKKFGVLPATLEDRARQMRFMHSRGFDSDTLRKLMRPDADE